MSSWRRRMRSHQWAIGQSLILTSGEARKVALGREGGALLVNLGGTGWNHSAGQAKRWLLRGCYSDDNDKIVCRVVVLRFPFAKYLVRRCVCDCALRLWWRDNLTSYIINQSLMRCHITFLRVFIFGCTRVLFREMLVEPGRQMAGNHFALRKHPN